MGDVPDIDQPEEVQEHVNHHQEDEVGGAAVPDQHEEGSDADQHQEVEVVGDADGQDGTDIDHHQQAEIVGAAVPVPVPDQQTVPPLRISLRNVHPQNPQRISPIRIDLRRVPPLRVSLNNDTEENDADVSIIRGDDTVEIIQGLRS